MNKAVSKFAGLKEAASAVRPVAAPPAAAVPDWDDLDQLDDAKLIPIDKVIPDPTQPRTEFDEVAIARLAANITKVGQLQPIVVRKDAEQQKFIIIAGERRYRASIKAGRTEIAATIISSRTPPAEVLELQIVENLHRLDLKPIEQAKAFERYRDFKKVTVECLAELLDMSQSQVSKSLALLNTPEPVQDAVAAKQLAPSVAYEIGRIDDPAKQIEIAHQVVSEKLTRSEAIELVEEARAATPAARPARGASASARPRTPPRGKPPRGEKVRTMKVGQAKITVEMRRIVSDEDLLQALRDAVAELEGRGVIAMPRMADLPLAN